MKTLGLEPGIYFDLAPSIYHNDPALSRSDIVALLDTPFTYWEKSWMNPDRPAPKAASNEMEFGDAFHCLMFEPERFEREYFVFPVDKWDNGRVMISKDDYDAMVSAIKVLRAGKNSNLFLSGGRAEVTVVFDAFGFRFRTRHDYLTPVCTVDFKTARSLHEGHLKRAFADYGYDIQMHLYKLARTRFREQFQAGEAHIFGSVDAEFFERFMTTDINDFVFIFQRKTRPYPYATLLPEDDTEQSGQDKVADALQLYERNMRKYGVKPWEVCDGEVRRFSMFYGLAKD